MTKNKIGLKLANGEFYPILEDGVAARKGLVVTTVQDSQQSVQIDLYRGVGPSVEGAEYIGSLVIEGIPSMPKGGPDIRMELGLADDGTLTARAEEASTHVSQSLKVSLEALSEEEKYEIPDFEFARESEGPAATVETFSDEDFAGTDNLPSEEESARLLADDEPEPAGPERQRRNPLVIALFALLALLVVLGLAFLVYRWSTGLRGLALFGLSSHTSTTQPAPTPQPAPPAPQPAATAPVASVQPAASPTAASTEPVKTALPGKKTTKAPAARTPGVWYKIKWGDTLWNLSYAYYRNPWYFGKIARVNKIRNPDLIIAGHRLWIPPR